MAIERTLSIIKPDAVNKNVIGQILSRFEANGLQIIGAKMLRLSKGQARIFMQCIRSVLSLVSWLNS